jgi:hypothetical protein
MGCQLNPQITDFRSVEAAEFRNAMRSLASGVAIVATGRGMSRRGLTVSSVTSLCLDPPCLLVGINTSSETHEAILDSRRFGVSLLGTAQQDLALHFAGRCEHRCARSNACCTSIRWSARTASSSGESLRRGTATARPSSIFTVSCAHYRQADRMAIIATRIACLGRGIER